MKTASHKFAMASALQAFVLAAVMFATAAPADDGFIPVERFGRMNMRAQKMIEHPQHDNWIGGTALAVAENSWPLVFQLPFFNSMHFAHGTDLSEHTRNILWDVQWGFASPQELECERLDPQHMGAFRPIMIRYVLSSDSLKTIREKKVVEKDWAHIRYRYFYGDGRTFDAVYSRCAPGFLFEATGNEMNLFAHNWMSFQLSGRPDKEVGACNWPRLGKKLMEYVEENEDDHHPYEVLKNILPHVAYHGGSIDYATFCVRPAAVAWAGAGGIETHEGSFETGLENMREPWMLVWHGGGSPLFAHTLPGFLSVGYNPAVAGFGLHQMDCPFLLVLENKPSSVTLHKEGLKLRYPAQAGKLVVMPLRGVNFFEASETEKWRSGGFVPDEVASECRFWAARVMDYPLKVRQSVKTDVQNDAVTVRNSFDYEAMADNWGFPRTRIAPVSPMVATAYSAGFPVKFSAAPADTRYFSRFGKYALVEGKDQYQYEIEGLNRYILDNKPVRELKTDAERELAAKLEREVGRMLDAGLLAPLTTFDGMYLRMSHHFQYPGDLLYSCASVAPYLEEKTRARLKTYLSGILDEYPPLMGERFAIGQGAPRNPYHVPPEITGKLQASGVNVLQMLTKRPELLYQLAVYAHRLEEWEYVDRNWEDIAYYFRLHLMSLDWASNFLGTLRCQSPNLGFLLGIHDVNRFAAGAIGYSRMADRAGRKEEASLGHALAAQWLLTRFACARFEESMIASGVVRKSEGLPDSPEWWKDNVFDRPGRHQVYAINQFGAMLDSRSPGAWIEGGGTYFRYKNLFTEMGLFLADFNPGQEQKPLLDTLAGNPIWHISGGVREPPADTCCEYFLGAAWLKCLDAAGLVGRIEEPDCLGDLYYFNKAAAALQLAPGE